MRPAPFRYREPRSLDEACAVLAAEPGEVAVLAGGQSLVPQLNARTRTPQLVLAIGRVPELGGVTLDDDRLRIGAAVTQRAVQRDPLAARVPVLAEALGHVGHVPTRNRGTVGGSIAFADPAAELPLVLLGLGGSAVAHSASGERRIPAAELFTGPFRTSLRPDELLTAVELPVPAHPWVFEQRHFRRHAKVSVVAGHDAGGALVVAVTGVGETPVLVPVPDTGDVAAVAATAADLVVPNGDRYGSVTYRRRLVAVAVTAALSRIAPDPARHTPSREDAA
ncbi:MULTISPECIES: FAD binding domain-containing protein [Pseudonocardia]|uniref:Caffeine dehydrogenase subunit beta n=2 Tax=Pseudonocardia TaxID=1847 RepID=A0A1Y2N6X3_PSEAH|nr:MULTISPECIES: FAD binding domain-containing protein [Pseudonocardia]OSY43225.1 Caffeine dehydrogenase subunit beta [Pseudonocardia autotrophica]TDN71713.1 carbon-monoxide dehydrogenase medium subunit [Pseudonocardia autotrophica]BBG02400.1 carbon monoxide dehydrogenase [Pseudonocardia autotrophica]GEC23264.1 carbon monoxide dehydrogenase [Pseudonocardia saturnea]